MLSEVARREECVKATFSKIEAAAPFYLHETATFLSSAPVDPTLTLDEDVGDIAGVRVAYAAFKRWSEGHPEAPLAVADLTPDQLFFAAFGQLWCESPSAGTQQLHAMLDPHAAARARVNGVLAQVPEFGAAFGCARGKPLHPDQTCELW